MDIDLLGYGGNEPSAVADRIRECLLVDVPPDGIIFDTENVKAETIIEGAEYRGVRVRIVATLGKMRLPIQVDVGFGDALVAEPSLLKYPVLLDQPAPKILVYPRESLVAEKFETMIKMGAANSRMKDFGDLYALSLSQAFDGERLIKALDATFNNRGVDISENIPLVLTSEFAKLPQKEIQWKGYVKKRQFSIQPSASLAEVMLSLRGFLLMPFEALREGKSFPFQWLPGGPWKKA